MWKRRPSRPVIRNLPISKHKKRGALLLFFFTFACAINLEDGMKKYFSLIKFSHTIFALPFALVGFFLAAYQPAYTL